MIKKEICKLRAKLNELIRVGADYSLIYETSMELDNLIIKYYKDF